MENSALKTWHREGAVLLDRFIDEEEIMAVRDDCDSFFNERRKGQTATGDAVIKKREGHIGVFDPEQFINMDHIPFPTSPALNLIGLHPRLMAFARAALGTDDVRLYQCDAWAKYTGEADYDQPFHCDFKNHTLTVPGDMPAQRTINFMIYVTDVTDDLGAIHYVPNSESAEVVGEYRTIFPEGALGAELHSGMGDDWAEGKIRSFAGEMQTALKEKERSGAAVAGSVFAYGIDVYHRGTNLTRPGGHRYTITASYKAAGNDMIGWSAWPFHFLKPWDVIINNATPEQLACLGIPLPGDPFWTSTTLARTRLRWPGWDMTPWLEAAGQ